MELVHKGTASQRGHWLSPCWRSDADLRQPRADERYEQRERQRYYTVIANQIQVAPLYRHQIPEAGHYVPALSQDTDTNWLSDKHPDCYIFGLCAEICAFCKDAVGFELYKMRFAEALADIAMDDQVTRWSGPSLRTYTDGLVV